MTVGAGTAVGARTAVGPGTRNAGGLPFIVGGSALWGTDALFRRGLALDLPATTVVFLEHVLLTLLTLPVLLRARRRLRALRWRDWVAILLIGAGSSAGATVLFTAAFAYGDPNAPLLLQKLQPVVAVLGARVLLGERLLPRYGMFFGLAVGAAYLITFPDPTAVTVARLTPALLASGAAALWGLGTVLGRRLSTALDPAELTAVRFAVGLPASALLVAFVGGRPGFTAAAIADLPALLLLALIPGLAALALYYHGLSRTPASLATLGELAFPLSALVVNYVAFGATVSPTQALGVLLLSVTIALMSALARRGSRPLGVEDPLAGGPAQPAGLPVRP